MADTLTLNKKGFLIPIVPNKINDLNEAQRILSQLQKCISDVVQSLQNSIIPVINDDSYGTAWENSTYAPTQDKVYDKIEMLMDLDGSNLAIGSDADGDTYYRASGVLARLAKGTANYKMFMNAAGTAPEWASGIYSRYTTHDVSVTGAQEITGVGFTPGIVRFMAVIGSSNAVCFGTDDGTHAYVVGSQEDGAGGWARYLDRSLWLETASGVRARAYISAKGSDGFDLTWDKAGSPTGTATIFYDVSR